ncbi:hypothetical protein UlMin_040642 [Ulmus minor]
MYTVIRKQPRNSGSLYWKYKSEDAGSKKFIVGRFLEYKMLDSKTVISQVQEIQVILHEIHAKWMNLSETFQVATIIEKLPPVWKYFKNYLKHKRKEMSIEYLVVKLPIEEDNKHSEKKGYNLPVVKANVNHKANVVDDITQDVANINLCAVISEVNLVGSNPREWWIDTSDPRHICSNKGLNSVTYEIKGQGKVVLNMTFGKELTLNNVLYVSKIHKNLDEAIEKFVLYKNEVEKQLNKKMKVLRSDRGVEYESSFGEFCAKHGIIH